MSELTRGVGEKLGGKVLSEVFPILILKFLELFREPQSVSGSLKKETYNFPYSKVRFFRNLRFKKIGGLLHVMKNH